MDKRLSTRHLCQYFTLKFTKWCTVEDRFRTVPKDICQTLMTCHATNVNNTSNKQIAFSEFEALSVYQIFPLFQEFRRIGQDKSPKCKYWCMFMNVNGVMLRNIWAERDGLWPLLLKSVCSMLSCFFNHK